MKTIGTIFLEHLLENNKYNLLFIIMFCLYSCHSIKYQQENLQYDSLTQKNVYIFVEKMPNYNGGEVAFMNDFSKKLQYTFSESGESRESRQHGRGARRARVPFGRGGFGQNGPDIRYFGACPDDRADLQ